MKTVDVQRSVIALTIGIVMVSCGGGNKRDVAQSTTTETQVESQTQKRETLVSVITPHISSFQMEECKEKDGSNTAVYTSKSTVKKSAKSTGYIYSCKTLLEIYQLISQEIPQSKFILSKTLTDEQTKRLSQRFDVEIEVIDSPVTAKEIFQKLDSVSGLQTDILKVEIDTFALKQIKVSDNMKRIKNVNRKEFTVWTENDIIKVNGQVSSDNWLSIIKKEFNMPVCLDKSLENNLYQVKDIAIKKDLSSTDRQLILLEEAGLIIERKLEPLIVVNVQ